LIHNKGAPKERRALKRACDKELMMKKLIQSSPEGEEFAPTAEAGVAREEEMA